MQTIVKNEISKKGITSLFFDNGDEKRFPWNGIRCGLSWPQNEVPAYYIILGMEMRGGDYVSYGASPLFLLCEREVSDLSLETLFRQLGDDCTVTCCQDIYAQTGESFVEYADSFYEYERHKSVYAGLCPAYFPDNFDLGVSLIRDHIDRRLLELPKESILVEQLGQIRREDLKDNPDKRFYAINALRYAVATFFRDPPVVTQATLPEGDSHGEQSWMAS